MVILETCHLKMALLIQIKVLKWNGKLTVFQKNISKKLSRPTQIIKIVTYANSLNDCNKVYKLYPRFKKSKFQLLAFCMGENGSISRILSPMLGAPFIYCSYGNKATAPGQINIKHLKEIYSNFS